MLLQSHAEEIVLLPALPAAWPEGSFKGLCARGGLFVSANWRAGKAISATLEARLDGLHRIRPPRGTRIADVRSSGRRLMPEIEPDGTISLSVRAGRTYQLTLS
jgi:alpha-L-fucosidase 2